MRAAVAKRCIVLPAKRESFVSKSKTLLNSGDVHLLSAFRLHRSISSTCQRKEAAAASAKTSVEFFDVPRLPIIGSLIQRYSNLPTNLPTRTYDYWYESRERFGDFYCFGHPALGKGIFGDTYILTDPNEFMKILRKEGTFPCGITELQWPLVEYYSDAKTSGSPGAEAGFAIFHRGQDWQRSRRFLQSDLLHPTAAKGYLPGMIRACEIASKGAPLHSKDITVFAAFCSFDMFSSILFGEFTGLASGQSSNDDNERFCDVTLEAMKNINPMVRNPMVLLKKKIGIKTEDYVAFEENFEESRRIATRKMKEFKLRKENGGLVNDFEKNSYASRSIDRFLASIGEKDALKEDDIIEILVVALISALDTTSSILNWSLIHLAMNPEVQKELRREVEANIASSGVGSLTADCFTKSNNVYLDGFLRENQRMTKPIGVNLVKENIMDEVEIHGKTIPKGNVFILDSRSAGMDPSLMKDPDVFDPARWSPKEVQKRKGTPAEFLDHPLYHGAFSAGARKCPGSRVASYEIKALLSQLLLDWEISFANNGSTKPQTWRDIKYYNGLTIRPEVPELNFKRR